MFIMVQTPPGTTQQRTQNILTQVSDYMLHNESHAVESTFEVNGFSFAGRGQNAGIVFVRLRDWSIRNTTELRVQALMERATRYFSTIRGAKIVTINPPPIPELGVASGFDLELEDRGGLGHAALMQARAQFLTMANQDPSLRQVHPNGFDDTPTFTVNIDREKASAYGLSLSAIDQTFSTLWASTYVDNFLDTDGRIKKVFVQGDAPYRMNPADLGRWYVRNSQGNMTPFSAVATGRWTYGSPKLERYNGISSVEIQGLPAGGRSTGDAIASVERLIPKLPSGIGYEWTGMTYQELLSGSQAPYLYGISVLVVFLSLAALYESWAIPFAVIMVVPLGVIGALLATTFRGLTNDVYFQVGLLTTVGLSAKNAILIVEFARDLVAGGRSPVDAAMEAARLRLRPILMTSMAFILGVSPLAISNGAGSAGQHAIGTGVIGGMFTATFFAIFLIPMFFVVISGRFGPKPLPTPVEA